LLFVYKLILWAGERSMT